MNWATVLVLLAKVLVDKFGWFGVYVHDKLSDSSLSSIVDEPVPESALAAPNELQSAVVKFLRDALNKVNVGVFGRIVLNRAIDLVPQIIDQLWDLLFSKGMVGVSYSQHPDNAAPYVSTVNNPVPDEIIELIAA